MVKVNLGYSNLQGSYLFAEIAKRVSDFQKSNSDKKILKLGIGDVSMPLSKSVISALHVAVDEMGNKETFKGYGTSSGYDFLTKVINENDFKSRGVDIGDDEIFVSTGAKEDSANFQELFSVDTVIAVPDPVYPVYVDSNVMAGRSGEFKNGRFERFVYLEGTVENNFKPSLPSQKVDVIYLCFPNNPTGQVLTKDELKQWVDYAKKNGSIIIFDAAYEAFIREDNIPHSIYEIDGAKDVAVEMRSFSKTAGFTGTRCAYTVVPKQLMGEDANGNKVSLNQMWSRRQATKFNGVAYIIQKAAQAVYSPEGKKETAALVNYYMNNASIIAEAMEDLGFEYSGAVNAPYVWVKTPSGMSSWDFFAFLLNNANIVGTPGAGFGKCGEGFFRFSSFADTKTVEEAVKRIKNLKI